MNHIYFDKRRLYLAGVATLLNNSLSKSKKSPSSSYNLSVTHFKGDSRKPILQIVPPFSSVVVVRLIPVVSGCDTAVCYVCEVL